MKSLLHEFTGIVRVANENPKAERVVRRMIVKVVNDCDTPAELIQEIGQCIARAWKDYARDKVERN